jgi:hypothetical protein
MDLIVETKSRVPRAAKVCRLEPLKHESQEIPIALDHWSMALLCPSMVRMAKSRDSCHTTSFKCSFVIVSTMFQDPESGPPHFLSCECYRPLRTATGWP